MTKQIFLIAAIALILTSCGQKPQTIKAEQAPSTSSGQAPSTGSEQAPSTNSGQEKSASAVTANSSLPEDISFAVGLYNSGQYEQAQSAFEKSISSGSVNWQSFYYLGLTCKELKEYDHAKSSVQQALTFAPNDQMIRSDIYFAMAEISEVSGNAQQALMQYHMAVNLNPENGKAKDGVARLSPHSAR